MQSTSVSSPQAPSPSGKYSRAPDVQGTRAGGTSAGSFTFCIPALPLWDEDTQVDGDCVP